MIEWQDLLAALALVLVFEGIMPFLNPGGLRKMLAVIDGLTDKQLRIFGVLSMAVGLILLYFIKH
jgi:uncharacterized protein YjeT (DUF2065 family)